MSGRLIVFYNPSFPAAEAAGLPASAAALHAFDVVCRAEDLAEALESAGGQGASFVNLHAPYFPKSAWRAILGFLRNGGGLVSVGGAPSNALSVWRMALGWWSTNRRHITSSFTYMKRCQ